MLVLPVVNFAVLFTFIHTCGVALVWNVSCGRVNWENCSCHCVINQLRVLSTLALLPLGRSRQRTWMVNQVQSMY